MAYSDFLIDRVERVFKQKKINAEGKKFMGGYCFFLDDKMCIGLDVDKKTGKDRLMARIGENVIEEALKRKGCMPMDITGRPMKGFVFVAPEGFDLDRDLEYWIQLAINFNPLAKSSKRKK
ncbi:TfoX/Sxy family protein [Changchengzhania lutea]|uniref:TfoX/Sxy family protein n=1 Tax=Changchengzhania lutea TaxID=2049305 RepID=UPI00115DE6A8|nr:TfoX/Sxy family protein [Changchengzhania lutea]